MALIVIKVFNDHRPRTLDVINNKTDRMAVIAKCDQCDWRSRALPSRLYANAAAALHVRTKDQTLVTILDPHPQRWSQPWHE